MSRPVRSTYFWSMGRERKHLREESNKPNERIKSNIASESDKSDEHCSTACHRNRDTACSGTDHCYVNACEHGTDTECANCKCFNCTCNKDRELPSKHGDSCTCPVCRDFNDYTTAIADPQRERSSTGIWIGNELRTTQCTDTDATSTIEYITGIPTGATI